MKPRRAHVYLLTSVLALPALASAQERPSRPFRGLFGGGLGDTEQVLTVSFGAVGGRDVVSTDAPEGTLVSGVPVGSSTFGSWNGQATYGVSRARFGLTASATAYSRYSADESEPIARSASATGRWLVLKHTTLSAGAQTVHQPLSVLSFFPGLPVGGVDRSTLASYTLGNVPNIYVSDQGQIGLAQQITRRSTMSVGYSYQRANFAQVAGARDVQTGAIDFSHQLTRSLTLRAGYQESSSSYGVDETTGDTLWFQNRTINAGVDYSGSLTLSRRTTLAVSTGSALISDRVTRRFRLTGNAILRREIGRSWDLNLSYDRQAGFIQTLREPVFTDSLTSSLNGLLARRVSVYSSFGLAGGSVGFRSSMNGYKAYHGGAGVSMATSRYLSFRVSYSYYRFEADNPQLLPLGLGLLSRHGIVAGVDVFTPIIARARRGNAAR